MIRLLVLMFMTILTQQSLAGDYGLFPAEQDNHPQAEVIRKATVAIIQNEKLQDPNLFSLGDHYRFCMSQPMENEKLWANCSGTLVGKDLVLTAGHCISSETDCSDKSYVFDFLSNSDIPRIQNNENLIYKCKKVLAWSKPVPRQQLVDYALIQLDREVQDRQPISISKTKIGQETNLTTFGFPLGMPMKISKGYINKEDAQKNLSQKSSFAYSKMPTHGGLSGGGVYDDNYNLIGVLVRGAANIERDGRCQRILECNSTDCPWAEVQRIDRLRIMNILRPK